MNQLNPTGALSEIDRLGQTALDAIYAEGKIRTPEMERIMREAKSRTDGNLMADIATAIGGTEQDAITRLLELMRTSSDREKAVNAYVQIRRSFEAAGLV